MSNGVDKAFDQDYGVFRGNTVAKAVGSLDDDPEQAAQAKQLSQSTGVPSGAIQADPDTFFGRYKSMLTRQLVGENPYLQAYIAQEPVARSASNDDWGALDKYTETLARAADNELYKMWKAGTDAFKGARQEFDLAFPSIQDQAKQSAIDNIKQTLMGPVRLGLSGMGMLAVPFAPFAQGGADLIAEPVSYGWRKTQEAIADAFDLSKESIPSREESAKFISDSIQQAIMLMGERPGFREASTLVRAAKIQEALKPYQDFANTVAPWIDKGELPPQGVHPWVDELYKQQTGVDAKKFDEAFKDAQATATRERSADLLATLGRIVDEGDVGIQASAIRKLYGDELPHRDDGKLGFIEDLQSKLAAAEIYGGDVNIPRAEYFARVDPEIHDTLKENLRYRPGGMTLEQSKAPKPEVPEGALATPIRDATDAIEQATRTAPAFAEGWTKAETAIAPANFKSIIPENAEVAGQVSNGRISVPTIASFKLSDILPLLDHSQLHEGAQVLSEFFGGRLNELVGDTPVHVVSRQHFGFLMPERPKAGGYHQAGAGIVLPKEMVDGTLPTWVQSHIILHEGAHAATVEAIKRFPELKSTIRKVMSEVDEYLKRAAPDLRKELDYGFKDELEFMAESWSSSRFRDAIQDTPISGDLAKELRLGEKTHTMWDAVKGIFKDLWSRLVGRDIPNSAMDAVFRLNDMIEELNKRVVEGKDVGAPAMAEEVKPGEAARAPTKVEQLIGRARTLGLTEPQLKEYIKAIQADEGIKERYRQELESRQTALRLTKEWKEAEARVKDEARTDLLGRPDVTADNFFRTGKLLGVEGRKPVIDSDALNREQRRMLPREYQSKLGVRGDHPDALAGKLGYETGDKMINDLIRMHLDRQEGGLTPAAQMTRMVSAEAERRMQEKYGKPLRDAQIGEAQDNVLSDKLFDRMVIEVNAAAQKAGVGGLPITKEKLKAETTKAFRAKTVGESGVVNFLTAAGNAGERAELIGKKGEQPSASEALQGKLEQTKALMMSKLARDAEKGMTQFQRLAKRYSKRDVANRDTEATNFIHQILDRYGLPIGRNRDDLAAAIARGDHADLAEYVKYKNTPLSYADPDTTPMAVKLPIAPFLMDPAAKPKALKDLTNDEFELLHGSLKALDAESRSDKSVMVKGKKRDQTEIISLIKEQLQNAKGDRPILGPGDIAPSGAKHLNVGLIQIQTTMRILDNFDPDGILQQVLIRPIMENFAEKIAMDKEFAKKYRAIGDFGDLSKKMENTLLRNADGELLPMTRGEWLSVLQNWGNPSQRIKLAGGYGVKDPQLIHDHLTKIFGKEDWDRAQKLGDLFEELWSLAEKEYQNLYGWVPPRIDIEPIQTPWGEYRGWYHKLVPNPIMSKTSFGSAAELMDEGGFTRTSTAASYTKGRTGAIYPILLNFDMVTHTIKQIINDINMRGPVEQVGSIIEDSRFKSAIEQYAGKGTYRALKDWLRDSAGISSYSNATMAAALRVIDGVRGNVMSSVIGLNPGTPMKHFPTALLMSMQEVGPTRFVKAFTKLLSESPNPDVSWWHFGMHGGMVNGEQWNGSTMLQSRLRSWIETLSGSEQDLFRRYSLSNKYFTLRDIINTVGASPVAISDLISAVPTWVAGYIKAIEEGKEHGEAVYAADTSVQRAHGSSMTPARPALMRAGPVAAFATPFYGFFNTALNRSYEMAVMARMALENKELRQVGTESIASDERGRVVTLSRKEYSEVLSLEDRVEQFKKGRSLLPKLAGAAFVFLIAAPLIEQAVSPLEHQKGESEASYWMKAFLVGWSGYLPFIRDVVRGAFEGKGYRASLGLYDEPVARIEKFYNDLKDGSVAFDRRHAARTLRDFNGLIAGLSGLSFDQLGKTGEYIWDVEHGRERPQNAWQILEGLRYGTQKHHSKDFDTYLQSAFGGKRVR